VPEVSVIIPTYNSADLVVEAIDSVLAQTVSDYEIIVVDDGSTDNIDEVIKSYDAPIEFMKQPNGGAAVARNTGMQRASGEYIALLDADDIWLPSKLETQVEFLDRNPDVGMVCCDGFRWIPPAQPSEGRLLSVLRGRPPRRPTLDLMFKMHMINTSSVVFRKDLFKRTGYMNQAIKHGQDFEFFLRLAALKPVAYIDFPLMAYRVHSANTASFVTRENVRRRIGQKLLQREFALRSVPKLQECFAIKVFAKVPTPAQYTMLLYWRIKYGGSIVYLMSCFLRYAKKLLPPVNWLCRYQE
jgi:glycosyltransferase involved in cell wall biosynthesis